MSVTGSVSTQAAGLTTRLCRDCKWSRVYWLDRLLCSRPYQFALCANPKFATAEDRADEAVDGVQTHDHPYCSWMREEEDECGMAGTAWEPRQ